MRINAKIIIEKTFNDGYLGSLIDEEHGKMWKVMWNAELCESLNCWIQIVPVEFSSTSIHVWVLDFYLLKKNACGSFFQQFPSFYQKKGKREKEKLKKEKNTTKRETVPTTNLHFLIVSYKKKRNIFCDWEGFIGRYIFVIISGEVEGKKEQWTWKNFTLLFSSFLIYLFFPLSLLIPHFSFQGYNIWIL